MVMPQLTPSRVECVDESLAAPSRELARGDELTHAPDQVLDALGRCLHLDHSAVGTRTDSVAHGYRNHKAAGALKAMFQREAMVRQRQWGHVGAIPVGDRGSPTRGARI